ncbi:MAG: hypothetical protein EAZ55_13945 [Cytophagales bacterium]|nr:MAG: hypothetical protein EAZ55_13945 [Cytophagales bacterium]
MKSLLLYIFTLLFLTNIHCLQAQNNTQENIQVYEMIKRMKQKPIGTFLTKRSPIGTKIYYALTLKHAPEMQIVFPDSTHNFSPFEFQKMTPYPTETNNNISTDSVIYELVSFEVDRIQTLSLPVYILAGEDSVRYYSNLDTVLIEEMIKGNIDTLQYRENEQYENLNPYFNYPYLITGILSIVLVGWLGWILLGGRIRKAYLLYDIRTRHGRFIRDFKKLTNRIKVRQSAEDVERILILWKNHLTLLEKEPFNTFTTKEIVQKITNEQLAFSLRNIDKAIYGSDVSEDLENDISMLQNISSISFDKRQKELQNEKV